MDDHDREVLCKGLELGDQAILSVLRDVTQDLSVLQAEGGRWSILECVEHVAIAEEYMLGQVEAATLSTTPVVNVRRESGILKFGADRTKRVASPDVGKPTGRFTTLDEALQHFQICRRRTLQFVENCHEDPRAMLTTHALLGPVNAYETLLLIAVHPQRHAKQIDEIRTTLQF